MSEQAVLSQPAAARARVRANGFDLEDSLQRTLRGAARRAGRKPITLSLAIAENVPPRVGANRARLNVVLEELLGNALGHTERGRVTLSVELVDLQHRGGDERQLLHRMLQFGVHDTGPGIPPAECEALFRKFSRFRGAESGEPRSVGLGLSLCKRLVESMGGTIWLESEAGRGTSVYFAITVTVPVRATRSKRSLDGVRSLIIEEAPGVSDPIRELVERWGVHTTAMSEPEEIFDSVEFGERFDFVLADIRGVLTPALRCARAVRDSPMTRELPFIAVAPASGTRRGSWTGFPTVLSAPVEPGSLYATIHRLLGRPRPLPA